MARIIIPTSQTEATYTQRTVLDGLEYHLLLDFNARQGLWSLSISDAAEAPIYKGIWVVTNWPLLRRIADRRRPPGELMAVDTAGGDASAGLTELGGRVQLIYFDKAEVTAGSSLAA